MLPPLIGLLKNVWEKFEVAVFGTVVTSHPALRLLSYCLRDRVVTIPFLLKSAFV
jgi:hypothetical protein